MSDPVHLRVRFIHNEGGTAALPDPDLDEVVAQAEAMGAGEQESSFDHEDVIGVAVEPQGTYRLESSSFFVPLAAGDLVRAAEDARGQLQVIDVVEPCDAVLTIFAPDAEASPETITALMRIWEATGAGRSERGGPFVATVWPDMPMDAIAAQLNADQAAGRGEWILAAEPHERRREAQDEIDFEIPGAQA
ncbi:MAG: hypothetical protein QOD98_3091 [Nocardioidaceae bacterium]|nr:hypothetical protein [Nocardioidaceae bacterium]